MSNLNNVMATLDRLVTNGEISNIAYAEILESVIVDDNDSYIQPDCHYEYKSDKFSWLQPDQNYDSK